MGNGVRWKLGKLMISFKTQASLVTTNWHLVIAYRCIAVVLRLSCVEKKKKKKKKKETMTIPWCMKRAELLYKCLKGFLMENSSWGGSEIRTLQFLIPPDVSPDVFSKLSLMLP